MESASPMTAASPQTACYCDGRGASPAGQFSARSLAALRPIRALVLADSVAARSALVTILQQDSRLVVVGWGSGQLPAADRVQQLAPDVVILEVGHPAADGIATIAQIMAKTPTRVVAITPNQDSDGARRAMAVVRAGALAVIQGPGDEDSDAFAANALSVRDVVRAAATVRLARTVGPAILPGTDPREAHVASPAAAAIVVVWSAAIQDWLSPVLQVLECRGNVPILLVAAPGEMEMAARAWPACGDKRPCRVTDRPMPLHPGHVYLVDTESEVQALDHGWFVAPGPTVDAAPEHTRIFRSTLGHFGDKAIAILPGWWQGHWLQVARHWSSTGATVLAVGAEQRPRRADTPAGTTVGHLADLMLTGPALAAHLVKYLGCQSAEARR